MCSVTIPTCFVIQHILVKVFCSWVRLSWLRVLIKSSIYIYIYIFFSQFVLAVTERSVKILLIAELLISSFNSLFVLRFVDICAEV